MVRLRGQIGFQIFDVIWRGVISALVPIYSNVSWSALVCIYSVEDGQSWAQNRMFVANADIFVVRWYFLLDFGFQSEFAGKSDFYVQNLKTSNN